MLGSIAAADELLGRDDVDPNQRAAELVLRSQAHVAAGDLAAAERDYEEILTLTPGYVPDAAQTPSQALERFRRVQARTVGRWILRSDPADVRVTIDGREARPEADGAIVLVAGAHVVQLSREGFDSLELTVNVTAGGETSSDAQLIPNARAIVIRTEPDGVEVLIDGVPAGRTARPPGAEEAAAELLVPNLALGEHVIELRKPCFQAERRPEIVAADLLSRGPRVYDVVRLVPTRSMLALGDGPPQAEVVVDGETMGRLPVEPIALCPGPHRLELRHGGRRIWTSTEDLEEGEVRGLAISPRPNVALVGGDEWPELLVEWRGKFNLVAVRPPDGPVPTTVEDWQTLDLATDIDLALSPAGAWALHVYSPHLQTVTRVDSKPPAGDAERPRWSRLRWGLSLADGSTTGPALVVEVEAGGPAARAGLAPGDRIRSVGGMEVADAAGVRRILGVVSARAPVTVEWHAPDGSVHAAPLSGEPTGVLEVPPATGMLAAMTRAAWAAVDADSDAQTGPLALANLALLLSEHGVPGRAVEVWKRVRLPQRRGLGEGTVQYFLGGQLALVGRRAEALRAFERAAASAATAQDDEGPPIAPAARDRLREMTSATGP